jgi:riboflavin kinase/FMN adenylyltransferase
MIKISGVVVLGKKKGTDLGFPTANIKLTEKLESGIYSGQAVVSGKRYRSAIFISERKNILETHILNFSGNLYGEKIEVLVKDKIRKARVFENDEDLRNQIKKDIEKIKKL